MMKLQTSNKINATNTKSNSKNTLARVKTVTSERKIVKIDSDQKMLETTDPVQKEDVSKTVLMIKSKFRAATTTSCGSCRERRGEYDE